MTSTPSVPLTFSIAKPDHADAIVDLINAAFHSDTTDQAWLTDTRVEIANKGFIIPMIKSPDMRFLIATATPSDSVQTNTTDTACTAASETNPAILACCYVKTNPSAERNFPPTNNASIASTTSTASSATEALAVPSTLLKPHPTAPSTKTAWLGFLCVSPAQHSRGLGRQMLLHAEGYVQREWPGTNRMQFNVVSSRTQLREWYVRCGYREVGTSVPFPYGATPKGVLREGLVMVDYARSLE